MNYIECQVLTVKDGEELTVGNIAVYSIPKVGEYIWFSKERLGHTSWVVEDVAHWVGDGELGSYPMGYQRVAIYAKQIGRAHV